MKREKKIISFVYYTPGTKHKVGLFKYGQWIEVYPGEILPCHPSLDFEMRTMNKMKRAKGQKVYKTQKEAMKAKGNLRLTISE